MFDMRFHRTIFIVAYQAGRMTDVWETVSEKGEMWCSIDAELMPSGALEHGQVKRSAIPRSEG